jgi:hypothetical protein
MAHRYFQDALLTSPSASKLRALGVVNRNTKSVLISFGEGDDALRRKIRVTHRQFPNGGGWSFFSALNASGARVCSSSTTAQSCAGGVAPLAGRAIAARAARRSSVMQRGWRGSKKLNELLDGGPARLHPRPRRALDRRRELTISLRRALIRRRQDLLGGLNPQ